MWKGGEGGGASQGEEGKCRWWAQRVAAPGKRVDERCTLALNHLPMIMIMLMRGRYTPYLSSLCLRLC